MIDTNACSTARGRHAELVHLVARLANGRAYRDDHAPVGTRCGLHSCQQLWPCDGWRFGEQVIAAQGG